MRINSSALRYMWAYQKASHEGVLTHKSPKDSSPTAKQFRLISNLLFYELRTGSSSKKEGPDIGVMLVEKCIIDRVGTAGQPTRMFSIVFDGEDWAKHYFTASTPEQCTKWVTALTGASYQHLRARIAELQTALPNGTNSLTFERVQATVLKKMGHRGFVLNKSCDSLEKRVERPPVKPKTKIKHKGKLGSTFYGVEESTEPSRSTMTRPQSVPDLAAQSKPPKSKFFAQLDVVKAPSKSATLGVSDRAVSSTVDELRKKAMTIDRKTTPSAGNHKETNSVVTTVPIPVRRAPVYNPARASKTLSADLLQFDSSPECHVSPAFISCSVAKSRSNQNLMNIPNITGPMVSQTPNHTAPEPNQSSAIHDLIGLDFNM